MSSENIQKLRQDISSILNVRNNKLQISKFINVSGGRFKLVFPDTVNRQKCYDILKPAENKLNIKLNLSQKLLPKLTIPNISKDTPKSDLIEIICDQNPDIKDLTDKGQTFEVIFTSNRANSDQYDAVIRASPQIRDLIINKNSGYLYIEFSRYKVYDRFFIKRCQKCQEFGHTLKNCSKNSVCKFCASNHESEKCHHEKKPEFWKCYLCSSSKNKNFQENCHSHYCASESCPIINEAMKRVKSNTMLEIPTNLPLKFKVSADVFCVRIGLFNNNVEFVFCMIYSVIIISLLFLFFV